MFQELLSGFLSSEHGANALGALQKQGYSGDDAQNLLTTALPHAATAMHEQTASHADPAAGMFSLFGGHAGRDFLLGAVAGLMRGDGFTAALGDGAMGAIGGRIAEGLASSLGLDPSVAAGLASTITPFIVHYAHDHLSKHPSNG
jgi:hypothetical protein